MRHLSVSHQNRLDLLRITQKFDSNSEKRTQNCIQRAQAYQCSKIFGCVYAVNCVRCKYRNYMFFSQFCCGIEVPEHDRSRDDMMRQTDATSSVFQFFFHIFFWEIFSQNNQDFSISIGLFNISCHGNLISNSV